MKGERFHVMVVGDILLQGSIIGAEHLLRGGGVDNSLLHGAAGVKQQRSARRDADIAYRKEHRAGGLTVAVDAKAFARGIVLLYHRQELRKRVGTGRAVAHVQGRYGAIRVCRLPREAAGGEEKSNRAQGARQSPRQSLPSLQNALLNRLGFDQRLRPDRYARTRFRTRA